MSKFEKVKYYYAAGLWSKERVLKALEKGWITKKEYARIIPKA